MFCKSISKLKNQTKIKPKTMKKLLFAAFVCVCMSGLVATTTHRDSPPRVPKWLEGEWEGVGFQPDMPSNWNTILKSDPASGILKVNYPTIPCSGKWLITEIQKDRVIAKEEITENVQNCIQGEKVTIIKVDERQIAIIYSLREGEVANAYSVLVKK